MLNSFTPTRSKVLSIFKALHRTRQEVFKEDEQALSYVRVKINDEFRKFRSLRDPGEIGELLKVATESNEILKTKVIQAQEIRQNVYTIRSEHLQQKCTGVRETCANCNCM